jgi:hypothetical protein
LTCMHSDAELYARDRLVGMIGRLEAYDAIDQVEILCARRLLAPSDQLVRDDWQALIRTKLDYLPPAVWEQLTRLRMLLPYTGADIAQNEATLVASKVAS